MVRRAFFMLAFVSVLAVPAQTQAQLGVDFTSVTNAGFAAVDGTYGWAFTALANSTVTGLAFYDHLMDGLNRSHGVGLWTAGGTLLASTTFSAGTGSPLMGFFRTMSIASVALTAGSTYVVGAQFSGGSTDDFIGTSHSGLTFDPAIQWVEARVDGPPGLHMPVNVCPGCGPDYYYGANIVLSVPEPGSMMLVAAGLFGLVGLRRRREDLTEEV